MRDALEGNCKVLKAPRLYVLDRNVTLKEDDYSIGKEKLNTTSVYTNRRQQGQCGIFYDKAHRTDP